MNLYNSAEVSAFRTRRWHLSSHRLKNYNLQISRKLRQCGKQHLTSVLHQLFGPMQLLALWCYGGIGCGPNWRSTKRWSHCWRSSRWWRNATRRWNSRVAEQAGYITSSRSEGISVPTWLRSGLKASSEFQTVPHCSVRN